MYDTTTERYSHLAGLSEMEIRIVMFIADVICDNITKARNDRSNPALVFSPKRTTMKTEAGNRL